MSAPCFRSSSPWPTRSTPITSRNSPRRPASTPARESSTMTASCGLTPNRLAASRKIAGSGLPFRRSRAESAPSILTSKSPRIPAASSTFSALRLADTAAVRMPLDFSCSMNVTEDSYGLTRCRFRRWRKYRFFRLPSPHIVSWSGLSSGLPYGGRMPRDSRKALTPSYRGLPST